MIRGFVHHYRVSMTEGAPIAEEAVLREPWSNTFGRYAANVAIAYGFSAIIKVLAGDLLAHQAWDAPIGFSLVMGAFFASRADGTKSGQFRRRGVAPIAVAGIAVYWGWVWLKYRNAWLQPPPSAPVTIAIAIAAVAFGLWAMDRFERRIR